MLPVTLEEAKAQLQLGAGDNSRDTEVEGFVEDAAGWVEKFTGHILEARDVTEPFRGYRPVQLRAWPIEDRAVPGVAYIDSSGAAIAIPVARLDLSQRPARVSPGTGRFWPFVDSEQRFSVTIRAGYEDPEDVPRNMRRAMLVLISAYDADREGGDLFVKAEATARKLCNDFRLRRL